MLLTDGFGGFGGISRFNRDFLEAVDASTVVERVQVLPRVISEPIAEIIPEAVVYDRRAANGKLVFVNHVVSHMAQDGPIDLVVCGHLNLLSIAWMVARLRKARLALIIHGIEAWTPRKNPWVNRITRHIDAVIAVSRYSAKRFASWSGLPIERAIILPNCVDLARFHCQPRSLELVERYGLQSSRVILTLGRLASSERYKGFDEVLDVMPRLVERMPDLKYLIAGDGPDMIRLQEKAFSLGISKKVIFAGRISEEEKVAHYNLADAYVMPSSGEGFGIVLIEAAACGVPIVGSNADGSRDALLDGRLGRLVDPLKPQELIAAVTTALEDRSPRRRPDAVETFSVGNYRARVDAWLRQQDTVIARKRPA